MRCRTGTVNEMLPLQDWFGGSSRITRSAPPSLGQSDDIQPGLYSGRPGVHDVYSHVRAVSGSTRISLLYRGS